MPSLRARPSRPPARQASPAQLLADAKNAAGWRAEVAARRGYYNAARKWSALAAEIDVHLREAIALTAAGIARSDVDDA